MAAADGAGHDVGVGRPAVGGAEEKDHTREEAHADGEQVPTAAAKRAALS